MATPGSPTSPRGTALKKSGKDIVSRLTDPSLYTGAHKHRFDADGKGKGLAGRENIVEFKGHTNTRAVEPVPSAVAQPKKPVVQVALGKEKFGVQATKAPTVKLFRNGDKHHNGEVFTLKLLKTFDQVLDKASTLVKHYQLVPCEKFIRKI